MKLSDFVALFLQKEGIKHVFGLTGGAVVHFFDSIDKTCGIDPIYNHHEQASSFASEAYSRITNNLGACFVTTGPGGTNAITGLSAAWLDSIPCLFISGQQRLGHSNHKKPYRQRGSQQMDIVSLVSTVTKHAVMLTDPNMIRYELEKAVYIAKEGRPGPVWIDIPLDFQWQMIDVEKLPSFTPPKKELSNKNKSKKNVALMAEMLANSKRPIVVLGYGVRLGHAEEVVRDLIQHFKIPFVSTWNTIDMIPHSSPLYLGCTGIAAQRGANLALQNSDLVLALGSHLSMSITGTNFSRFAREAKKIVVDIDPIEIEHSPIKIDLPICGDVKEYSQELLNCESVVGNKTFWLSKCKEYKKENAIPQEWYNQKEKVNPYVFIDILSDAMVTSDTVVVDGGGTALYMSFQALKVKKGQRVMVSGAIGAMGSGLPESIGASFANNKGRTICMVGDGSMQLNIQELQTIAQHNLPIKIVIFNNSSYLSIRQTQEAFLNSNYTGSHSSGGVSLPDYQKVAAAYGIESVRVSSHQNIKEAVQNFLNAPGPTICEVMVKHDQPLIAKLGFKKFEDGTAVGLPLEDMEPFLDRSYFKKLMVVEPLPESLVSQK